FVLIQEFSALVTTGDLDLALLTTGTNLSTFKDTLVALSETETFYQAGSNLPGEVTVFEQIMRKIYVDTYLADLSYQQVVDYDPLVASIEQGINKKVTDSLVAFPSTSYLNGGSWINEIDAIGDLIVTFNGLGFTSGDFDGLSVDTLTPTQLSAILQSINRLDVVKDAIPFMIKDALYNENINFDRFSAYDKAEFTLDETSFAGPLTTVTLTDGTYSIDVTGNNVSSDGSTIEVALGGYLYNLDPINNISSLVIDAGAGSSFEVFYGTTPNPTVNSYFLTSEAGDVYTVDLSDVPYQYFRIEATTTFDIEQLTINQAIESGDYMQDQVSYRDVNIPILIDLMDEFYVDSTSTYYDFSQPEGVVGFVNDGNSTAPILAFIIDSKLYQTQITPEYKAESLFLYNILAFEMSVTVGGAPIDLESALAHNVRGTLTSDKLAKINDILNVDSLAKFDVTKEGDAIDYGLFAMSFLEGALSMPTAKSAFVSGLDLYLYNIVKYDTGSGIVNYLDLAVGSSTRGVIDNNFLDDYGHALLISEIVAGQLNDIMEEKYNYLVTNAIPYTEVDLYAGEYGALNATERVGLSGAVQALYYSLNDFLVPDTEMTAAEVTAAFEAMYDSDIAMIFYQADIYPCLSGNLLAGGRGLAVEANPTTLSNWQDIANALIASRGL
ncbi:MAG: hypothetical protein PHT30_00810, partial [Bacilli bacterium]|nr:hypothetical protein [Bacilli bacterium]